MVVAVVAVRVVQMAIHQIVDVVAVWNGWVPAAFTMSVVLGVSPTAMGGRAFRWVGVTHFQCALINVVFMGMMQVAVV